MYPGLYRAPHQADTARLHLLHAHANFAARIRIYVRRAVTDVGTTKPEATSGFQWFFGCR
jgi:hypothetical protein